MRELLVLLIGIIKCEYDVHLQLCTDTATRNNMLKESIGKKESLYMINNIQVNSRQNQKLNLGLINCEEKYCKWLIKADYHKASTRMMTVGPFPGKISDMDYLAFSYEAGDVLCLEKLIITDDTGKSMEIIQDYISWGWKTDNSESNWNSLAGRKLAYLSSMCRKKARDAENKQLILKPKGGLSMLYKESVLSKALVEIRETPLSRTAPFHQSCTSHIVIDLSAENECKLGTHNCHENAECIDTKNSYECKCEPGYSGNGFTGLDELPGVIRDQITCKLTSTTSTTLKTPITTNKTTATTIKTTTTTIKTTTTTSTTTTTTTITLTESTTTTSTTISTTKTTSTTRTTSTTTFKTISTTTSTTTTSTTTTTTLTTNSTMKKKPITTKTTSRSTTKTTITTTTKKQTTNTKISIDINRQENTTLGKKFTATENTINPNKTTNQRSSIKTTTSDLKTDSLLAKGLKVKTTTETTRRTIKSVTDDEDMSWYSREKLAFNFGTDNDKRMENDVNTSYNDKEENVEKETGAGDTSGSRLNLRGLIFKPNKMQDVIDSESLKSTVATINVLQENTFEPVADPIIDNVMQDKNSSDQKFAIFGSGFGEKSLEKYIVLKDVNSKLYTTFISSWSDKKIRVKSNEILPAGKYFIFLNTYHGHRSNYVEIDVNPEVKPKIESNYQKPNVDNKDAEFDALEMLLFDSYPTFDARPAEITNNVRARSFQLGKNPETAVSSGNDQGSVNFAKGLSRFCKAIECIQNIADYIKNRRRDNTELAQLFDAFQTVFEADFDKSLTKRLKTIMKNQL